MAKKRVLIVEDHKENADAIADFMRFVFPDWNIEFSATGKGAVDMSVKNPADVMVLDIALADDVNGLEVIKKLWENGLREKPRVVIITALGNKAFRGPRTGRPWVEQLNEQEKTLVSAFFEKPYGWHAFLSAVAKAGGIEPPENIKLIPDNE
jgi:CheY-like chemotaxis protein